LFKLCALGIPELELALVPVVVVPPVGAGVIGLVLIMNFSFRPEY
jgi:hypothetical protein